MANNSTLTFIVKKDSNIITFKGSQYTVTNDVIKKGTVFTGTLRTKVVGSGNDKRPVKVLQVDNGKNYLELSSSNIYMDELAKANKSVLDNGANDAPTTSKPYDTKYKENI